MNNILITGGRGFIGTNLVNHFVNLYPQYKIYNLDNLTYASSKKDIEILSAKDNYKFIKSQNIDLTLRPENLSEKLFYKITEFYEKKRAK